MRVLEQLLLQPTPSHFPFIYVIMNKNEIKKIKEEAKAAKKIAIYSTDFDMTLVIRYVFISVFVFVGALLTLELVVKVILNR